MNALELMQAVETAGGVLTLSGDRLRYGLPEEATALVDCLREHRDEIVRLLREQEEIPRMPNGVQLVSWCPKEAPIVITRWSVVADLHRFVRSTLQELEAALAGNNWLASNWSVQELVDRLEQVGARVRIL